jgi:aldehyde dehydrogenase (NAD+)
MSSIASVTVPQLNKTISIPTGLFINNEFVSSIDSQELIQFVNIFLYLVAIVR